MLAVLVYNPDVLVNAFRTSRILLRAAFTFLRHGSIQVSLDKKIIFFVACFKTNPQAKRPVSDYKYLQLTLHEQFPKREICFLGSGGMTTAKLLTPQDIFLTDV